MTRVYLPMNWMFNTAVDNSIIATTVFDEMLVYLMVFNVLNFKK